MKLVQMELTRSQIRTHTRPHPPLVRALARTLTLAAARLEVVWRSALWRSWVRRSWVRRSWVGRSWVGRSWVGRSWVCRAGSKRKELSVRETAALGDRRFVSVIQFERQRFLIASSPSSVTLLAQLSDESPSSEVTGENH